jgi:holo-ACP synthase CitX
MVTSPGSEVLAAREARYRLRRSLSAALGLATTVELSMCIPGHPKTGPTFARVFELGLQALTEGLGCAPCELLEDAAGYYALYRSSQPPHAVKRLACRIEASFAGARLLDIDVYDGSGKVTREHLNYTPRGCLVCSRGHVECIGRKAHAEDVVRQAALSLASELSLVANG